ncbi:MAG: hypothetical protein E5X00_21460 [Mesorhizobium sp.]|nr:MAG: hypothetical protein E5X92_09925 [Mesorhizobium sp.]TIS73195.1 MAG: hypothetical protein E5X00_21460 [Mesorhizobium sp.]
MAMRVSALSIGTAAMALTSFVSAAAGFTFEASLLAPCQTMAPPQARTAIDPATRRRRSGLL